MMYIMQNISVAETRQHLAEILGKVAYSGKAFLITKKGRPIARLLPLDKPKTLAKKPASWGDIKGWLEDDDPFFKTLETMRTEGWMRKPAKPVAKRRLK
jgi:prevent-host-death family protein